MTDVVNISPELIRMESLVENDSLLEKLTDAQLNNLFNKLDNKVKKDSFAHAMKYNRGDTARVEDIDDKLGFVRLAIGISHIAKCRGEEIFATVKPWDSMIYSRLSDMGIQIPPSGEVKESGQYAGGYVKAPIVGRHNWVISVDLKSLYPSIIRMLNMSIETLRRYRDKNPMDTMFSMVDMKWDNSIAKDNNWAVAGNGTMYDKSFEGVIPATMAYLSEERDKAKILMKVKKRELEKLLSENSSDVDEIRKLEDVISMLDAKQMALKILGNSGYGAIGNSAFRYYKEDIAEGITLTGQLAIRFIEKHINEYLNNVCNTLNYDYICAGDTDSQYIELSNWVTLNVNPEITDKQKIVDIIDKYVSEELEQFIASSYQDLSDYLNADKNLLIMKREAIADCAIFRGKKNYLINIFDNENVRYAEPKLKMVGIETARSSIPMIIRKELTKCLQLAVENDFDALQQEVIAFKKIHAGSDVEAIASPRGISDIDKWTSPEGECLNKTPIHVRAAIEYNKIVRNDSEYRKRYPIIKSGDKIKFIKLRQPNPIGSHVVAFIDELPKDFGLHEYVNRNVLFEETFISPLESFTSLINWNFRHSGKSTDLFESDDSDVVEVVVQKQAIDKKKVVKENEFSGSLNDLFG